MVKPYLGESVLGIQPRLFGIFARMLWPEDGVRASKGNTPESRQGGEELMQHGTRVGARCSASASPTYFKSDVPVASSGQWTVTKFMVHDRLPGQDNRPPWLRSPPGEYTRLSCGTTIFMTDLHDEWWTQRDAIHEACRRGGRVLITGLGLGLVAMSMLGTAGSGVEQVTIVENSEDVIRLVGDHLVSKFASRLEIVHASAYDWLPPKNARYSVVWHDIWPNPQAPCCWPEIAMLENHYAPFADWQGSWPRSYNQALAKSQDQGETQEFPRPEGPRRTAPLTQVECCR